MINIDWIAVDWGTTNLRVWAMSAGGDVLAKAQSDDGMGTLSPDGFEPALLNLISPWLGDGPIDIIACGMVGAAQGWTDAGYHPVPAHPPAGVIAAPVKDQRLRVKIVPGMSQGKPADVMRGEETQIAGFLATRPGFSGVICMPGTHTKWVQIEDGEVFHFATFMTGEIYALLTQKSVLRHTVEDGHAPKEFLAAMQDAMARPERMALQLFGLRAEAVLNALPATTAGARLSGMLLGLELAGARPYWLGREVILIAQGILKKNYEIGLDAVGLTMQSHDPNECVLNGLKAARLAGKEA